MVCIDSLCVKSRGEVPPKEASDPRFICRDKPWEQPGDETVEYSLNVSQLLGGKPYPNLTVKVCPSFDTKCEKPLSESTSNQEGKLTLNLPVGFHGHLFSRAPAEDPTLVPVEAYIFPPPSRDASVPKRPGLIVTNMAVIQGLASLDNVNVVPGTGHVIFTVSGCDGKPLDGIKIRTSITREDTWKVYVGNGGRPDPKLKATGPTGRGAILNLPPGYVTVIGEHPTLGKIFEQSVVVTANHLSSVPVIPSPVQKD